MGFMSIFSCCRGSSCGDGGLPSVVSSDSKIDLNELWKKVGKTASSKRDVDRACQISSADFKKLQQLVGDKVSNELRDFLVAGSSDEVRCPLKAAVFETDLATNLDFVLARYLITTIQPIQPFGETNRESRINSQQNPNDLYSGVLGMLSERYINGLKRWSKYFLCTRRAISAESNTAEFILIANREPLVSVSVNTRTKTVDFTITVNYQLFNTCGEAKPVGPSYPFEFTTSHNYDSSAALRTMGEFGITWRLVDQTTKKEIATGYVEDNYLTNHVLAKGERPIKPRLNPLSQGVSPLDRALSDSGRVSACISDAVREGSRGSKGGLCPAALRYCEQQEGPHEGFSGKDQGPSNPMYRM